MENSPPKLLVWLAGPRVGNKGFVLQNLELSVLTVVFDQWLAAMEAECCFNPQAEVPPRHERIWRNIFSLFLSENHLRKSLSGHWLTVETTEGKLQWTHTTKDIYFAKYSMEKLQKDGSSHEWRKLQQSLVSGKIRFPESYHSMTLRVSTSQQKLENVWRNRSVCSSLGK